MDRGHRLPRRCRAVTCSSTPPATGPAAPADDADGRAHLFGVMGPDEYHEVVDDNAYTNVMARWNLRRAAEAGRRDRRRPGRGRGVARPCRRDGRRLRPRTRPLRAVRRLLGPRAAADRPDRPAAGRGRRRCSGAERVAGSQLIKQADVLMLHHLVPDEVARRVARPEPRLLRAAHRARQLALARPSTPRCWPGPVSPTGRSSCSASRPASTSTI